MKRAAHLLEKIDMPVTLRLIFLFNLLDAILTVTWVKNGVAEEANPLMAYAMSYGMGTFITVKLTAVFLAVGILWCLRDRSISKLVSLLAAMFMFLVLVYHTVGLYLVTI